MEVVGESRWMRRVRVQKADASGELKLKSKLKSKFRILRLAAGAHYRAVLKSSSCWPPVPTLT